MAIITWLKERQKDASFMVTGAGPDWLETRFIRPPKNTLVFAKKMIDFAPDVLGHDQQTVDKVEESMNQMNGFSLVWD